MDSFVIDHIKPIRVLFLASEAAPLVKVGGLGDVAGTLPRYLLNLAENQKGPKIDLRLVIPYYPSLSETLKNDLPGLPFSVKYKNQNINGFAYRATINDIPTYLISGPPIQASKSIYSLEANEDMEKYIFFSLASLEMVKRDNWTPDIIHANDWHTAPAIFAIHQYRQEEVFFKNTKTVLTVHNLPFLGGDASLHYSNFGLVLKPLPSLPEWAQDLVLPVSLATADVITTVSPTYAQEMLTKEFGSGLEKFLKTSKTPIVGILNGLDLDDWDPGNDQVVSYPFSPDTLDEKNKNKMELLSYLGLEINKGIPLLVSISRMDHQKGIDLSLEALRKTIDQPWQAILMGSGNPNIEEECKKIEMEYPHRIKSIIEYNPSLARKIYAGGDIFLMPSRYEPCGLSQLIAMRFGTIPLARATGGLKDTIIDDPKLKVSTGFLFREASAADMATCLIRALDGYSKPDLWRKIQKNAMHQDFSWHKAAIQYAHLYQSLLS